MKAQLDIHTHTLASGHAYSTINEMAEAAKRNGLKVLGTTDHAPKMPGSAHIYHFHNLRALPKIINDVRILKGVEANIIDYNGSIDMPREILEELELVIASFHGPCIDPGGIKKTTDCLLNVINNPLINVIGHPEDRRYRFDIKSVVEISKVTKTYLEINNSSLLPTTFREGSREGIINILEECGKQGAKVVLGSDAHHSSNVGRFDEALDLIEELSFPKDLIINNSSTEFMNSLGIKE